MSSSVVSKSSTVKIYSSPSNHNTPTNCDTRGKQNKKEWNSYLTDITQYSISKKELLEKKKRLISRHNVLLNEDKSLYKFKSSLRMKKKTTNNVSLINKPSNDTYFRSNTKYTNDKTKNIPTKPSSSDDNSNKENISALDYLKNNFDGKNDDKRVHFKVRVKKPSSSPIYDEDITINNDDINSEYDDIDFSGIDLEDDENEENQKDSLYQPHKSIFYHTPSSNSKSSKSGSSPSTPRIIRTPRPFSSSPQKNLFGSSVKKASFNNNNKKHTINDILDDSFLKDIFTEINTLREELKYYEELSGKRSILNNEELDNALNSDLTEDGKISHKSVIRYLIQLVCQSMSHLLKSEIELQGQKSKYEYLESKVESLSALLLSTPNYLHQNNINYNNNNYKNNNDDNNEVEDVIRDDTNLITTTIDFKFPLLESSVANINNNNNNNSNETTPTSYNFYSSTTPNDPNGTVHYNNFKYPTSNDSLDNNNNTENKISTSQSLDDNNKNKSPLMISDNMLSVVNRCSYQSANNNNKEQVIIIDPIATSGINNTNSINFDSVSIYDASKKFTGTSASDWLFSPPPPPQLSTLEINSTNSTPSNFITPSMNKTKNNSTIKNKNNNNSVSKRLLFSPPLQVSYSSSSNNNNSDTNQEQLSIIDPNLFSPSPHSKPKHPFGNSNNNNKNNKNNNINIIDSLLSSQKSESRIYDARLGSF